MEPFKATKLWNKIIQDFRSLMPLKRHRWRMRPYDNCFTTTEAVDWLHEYLQNSSDFGPWVTRNQAVSLLEKFVQSKVIQQVKVGKTSKSKLLASDKNFEDNGQLYRFVPVSPIKKLRSAFSSRSNLHNSPKGASPELPQKPPIPKMESLDDPPKTIAMATHTSVTSQTSLTTHQQLNATPVIALQRKVQGAASQARPLGPYNGPGMRAPHGISSSSSAPMPQCRLVSRNLTMPEIEEVWKSSTLMRLQRLLWLSSLEGLLNADVVNPRNLIHNCTRVSRTGVVMVTNKEEDLPHWVLSAMRCLARWPNQTDSSLPAYSGFERDVFRTVFNYFDTLCEPLMTYSLYPLVTEAFIIAEQRERGIAPPGYEDEVLPAGMSCSSARGIQTFESVENLMLNMTMGGSYNDSMPTPGGYANPPVATPHGALDGPSHGCSTYLDTEEGGKKRDKPVYRRSVSMHIETTPQIQHGGGIRRRGNGNRHQSLSQQNRLGNGIGGQTLSRTSLNEYDSKSYYEAENHCNINRIGDISEYYRYNPDRHCCSKKSRPHSAHGFVGASKYQSESNMLDAEAQFADYQPRHFGSMTEVCTMEDPIPYMDDPCPKVIGRSPQSAVPSPITSANPTLCQITPSSDGGSFHSALDSVPNSTNPSPNMSEPSPTDQNSSKETAFSRLFRSSKRFGSASDLVQKILRKKSDSSLGRTAANSSYSSTKQTPPVINQSSTQRSATNSAASSKNNSPTETGEGTKISPSYPPPMRATLSMSKVVSSAENSANNTPDIVQSSSFGQRSMSAYDLNQIWPPPRPLDPFQQGLSQSSHNLRAPPPGLSQNLHQNGLSQSSRYFKSSHKGLNHSSKVYSAYSLNRSEVSELGGPHLKRSDSASSLYLNEDQSYMQESLKLCCLLLPPSNRRKLHLLLKLMSKIEQNDQLQLTRTRTARNLVLHTFTRCILRCREEIDLNERLAIRIVEYLMDNHAAIFSVPQDLQKDVDDRLVHLRRGQIKYTPDDMAREPSAFCRQISVVDYEKQKVSASQAAMEELLENIIIDNKMTAKDKRKRLKQFQKAYPYIYTKRMQMSSVSDAENIQPSSHCQKLSVKEYETQSLSASQRALEDLLENIIGSAEMGAKDKKRKLKRFEKQYPDLYRKRLPTSESEAQLFRPAQKPRIKPPMVNMKKSFRWKSIR